MDSIHQARLAQSVEHQTLNRRVVGSSPTVDKKFFILYFVASDALLAGRLAPCKWNQAWRPSELYMCIERELVDFKNREVNCLKECALALSSAWPRIDLTRLKPYGGEHVKKIFSTAVIDIEDTHSNVVRGHWCTGGDKITCAPWSLRRRTHCEHCTSF